MAMIPDNEFGTDQTEIHVGATWFMVDSFHGIMLYD
jgi:hypothetical protein